MCSTIVGQSVSSTYETECVIIRARDGAYEQFDIATQVPQAPYFSLSSLDNAHGLSHGIATKQLKTRLIFSSCGTGTYFYGKKRTKASSCTYLRWAVSKPPMKPPIRSVRARQLKRLCPFVYNLFFWNRELHPRLHTKCGGSWLRRYLRKQESYLATRSRNAAS